jgi:hypothetical protein
MVLRLVQAINCLIREDKKNKLKYQAYPSKIRPWAYLVGGRAPFLVQEVLWCRDARQYTDYATD